MEELDLDIFQQKNQEILTNLIEKGWSVSVDYLSSALSLTLLQEIKALHHLALFRPAGTGQDSETKIHSEIRNDSVYWPRPESLTATQTQIFSLIDLLRQQLNRELFLGLQEFEAHFTHYPPGSFYKKHLDQLRSQDSRKISCVLYLNQPWNHDDGGLLRLYKQDDHSVIEQEIVPLAGTFVCFLSDSIYHEVLPTHKERFALTGWLRNKGIGY